MRTLTTLASSPIRQGEQNRQDLLIDLLKALCMQVIVLHHLTSYGSLAHEALALAPQPAGFLYDYGRYVVAVFLATGGYLASQSMRARGGALDLPRTLARRYLRLAVPYLVAILVAVLAAAIARYRVHEAFVGDPVTLGQFAAHASLLQGILGFESLAAGLWYVSIDFQLFAFLAVLCVVFKNEVVRLIVLGGFMAAALYHFNRDANYDSYFVYFVASYGVGVLAEAIRHAQSAMVRRVAMALFIVAGLAIVAEVFQARAVRTLVAFSTAALLLACGARVWRIQGGRLARWLAWAGSRSYGVLVFHFAWILIACAVYPAHTRPSAIELTVAVVVVTVLSWLSADWVYRHVERPAGRLIARLT